MHQVDPSPDTWRSYGQHAVRHPSRRAARGFVVAASAALLGTTAAAEMPLRAELNLYGMPGIVDLPNAASMTDAEIATTISAFGGALRNTLAFQITPRLTGAFRYAYFGDADDPFSEDNPYWDRSFDLHYRLLDEGRYRPALALGLRDFIGTGLYSSEYLVATKTLPYGLRATAGLGWGRLSGRNAFDSPLGLDDRPPVDIGRGDTADLDQLFRGPISAFFGLEWQPSERLALAAEYTSDEYREEEDRFDALDPQGAVNLGLRYKLGDFTTLGAQYMQGDALGVSLTFALNPTRGLTGMGLDRPPPPFVVRPDRALAPTSWGEEWTALPSAEQTLRKTISAGLARVDLRLVGLTAEAGRITVEFENPTYGSTAQAVGRAARVLSDAAPASIETFVLVPVVKGMATSAVTLRRSALETQLHAADAGPASLQAARLTDAARLLRPLPEPDLYPRFRWNLGPYTQTSFFDPQNPILIDLGAQLAANYKPVHGLVFEGALRQKLVGNLDEMRLISGYPPGAPPVVRSDAHEYAQISDLTIPYLTADYFFRPGQNLYGRVTAGLLEQMYGGVSGEVLWQEPGRRLALGLEINHVRKRDYDQRFDFLDYEVTTGHASAYYDFGAGYFGQIDVGRYLAGDDGATFNLQRRFDNGVSVGAYATFTDVSFEEFGEGSFDKGIRIAIPMQFLTGRPSKETRTLNLQPITRDGGARLSVRNRLRGLVRDESPAQIAGSWGRFWR